ncbi:MAG TPA: hypothetical protein PK566_12795, partial [Pseudobacteroides sp.]|nr:hypothetical protein [Pseudobacteroides sp.]
CQGTSIVKKEFMQWNQILIRLIKLLQYERVFFMDLNEYIEWYQEHFGISPSQKLIEKFISVNQPIKMETVNDNDKKTVDNKRPS